MDDDIAKLALKERLMSKEAELKTKEHELFEKDKKVEDGMQKLAQKSSEKDPESHSKRDKIEQEIRDLRRIVSGWEEKERKRMLAEERDRFKRNEGAEIRKRIRIEESERERVRAQMMRNRKAKRPRK